MARVAGVDLPRDKRGEVALTYIYGVGRSSARRILSRAGVDLSRRVKDWTDDEITRLRDIIEREHKVEGDLRRETAVNIKRLMDISSYRGVRHRKGLPVRGQRTQQRGIVPGDHLVDQVLARRGQDESGDPADHEEAEAGRQPPAVHPEEIPRVAPGGARGFW